MNIPVLKVRCSHIHRIMTNSRSKTGLSETAKTLVEEYYIQHRFGRSKELTNKYINKGLAVEEDSITLFSKLNRKFLVKNKQSLENDYIIGTPDIFIKQADTITEVIDIKSSWDIWTYYRAKRALDDAYFWQVMGYMWLTNARKATVAFCLVDTPEVLINDEKRKLMWKMGAISDEDELYQLAAKVVEKNMRFDDIPIEHRVHTWTVEFQEDLIDQLKQRIEEARKYFIQLYEQDR